MTSGKSRIGLASVEYSGTTKICISAADLRLCITKVMRLAMIGRSLEMHDVSHTTIVHRQSPKSLLYGDVGPMQIFVVPL